jgi:hypothetical protein
VGLATHGADREQMRGDDGNDLEALLQRTTALQTITHDQGILAWSCVTSKRALGRDPRCNLAPVLGRR